MTPELREEATRTAIVDGGTVKALRKERGWNQATLAMKSDCSLRTVKNAEKGKPLFLTTVRNIADALGAPVSRLLLQAPKDLDRLLRHNVPLLKLTLAESVKPSALKRAGHDPGTFRIAVSFCLEGDHQAFKAKKGALREFVSSVSELIKACHELTPLRVTGGSIVITVEMTAADVRRLAAAYRAGRLDRLGVTDIVNESLVEWLYSSGEQGHIESLYHSPDSEDAPPSAPPSTS
jgi:transcriptional regulator with XRE-family HTH domain